MKRLLVGLSLSELQEILESYALKMEHAREICVWIYRKGITSISAIDTIPKKVRIKLDCEFTLTIPGPEKVQVSTDGTRKYLFRTANGYPYEAAFMPGSKRNTLCISTQSGCRMGCHFCHTGSMGYAENLSVADMMAQILSIPERKMINRLVFMGMGEPLDNPAAVFRALEIINAQWGMAFGATNITLSTVGILPMLDRLVQSKLCNIAISFHCPFAEQRKTMIPAEGIYPIRAIVEFFKNNPVIKPLRLSFEYVVIPGVNDSEAHATETAHLLGNLSSHINVIALNNLEGIATNRESAIAFQKKLNALGQSATFRLSRGYDIDAACGMMAGKVR